MKVYCAVALRVLLVEFRSPIFRTRKLSSPSQLWLEPLVPGFVRRQRRRRASSRCRRLAQFKPIEHLLIRFFEYRYLVCSVYGAKNPHPVHQTVFTYLLFYKHKNPVIPFLLIDTIWFFSKNVLQNLDRIRPSPYLLLFGIRSSSAPGDGILSSLFWNFFNSLKLVVLSGCLALLRNNLFWWTIEVFSRPYLAKAFHQGNSPFCTLSSDY